MKLEYLFTKSRKNLLGSRLIAWGTHKLQPDVDPCSHVAIKAGDFILESTVGKGVSIIPFKHWIQHHKVVHAFECPLNRRMQDVLETALDATWGRKYDWWGILFFTWRMLGYIVLGRDLPKKNRWHRKSHFFCVEVIGSITREKYEMVAPINLVALWDEAGISRLKPENYNKHLTISK